MKVLVTGAAGFVASHLCEELKYRGYDVIGLDAFTDYYNPEIKRHTASILKKKGIDIFNKDLASDDLTDVLEGVETIYHLAAQPGISATTSFETYEKNNIIAARRLMEAAKLQSSIYAFINIATSSVYGYYANSSEEVAPEPVSDYGVSKLAAEQMLMSWQRSNKLPACSLRLFSVYGERERPEKLFPKLVNAIIKDEEFPLFEGSEEHLRSFTYVSDIVNAFISVLDNWKAAKGEIFNIGCETQISTGEAIKIVEEIMGTPVRKKIVAKRPGDQLATHADISKAKRLLNYTPKIQPREGLANFVAWFKSEIAGKIDYR